MGTPTLQVSWANTTPPKSLSFHDFWGLLKDTKNHLKTNKSGSNRFNRYEYIMVSQHPYSKHWNHCKCAFIMLHREISPASRPEVAVWKVLTAGLNRQTPTAESIHHSWKHHAPRKNQHWLLPFFVLKVRASWKIDMFGKFVLKKMHFRKISSNPLRDECICIWVFKSNGLHPSISSLKIPNTAATNHSIAVDHVLSFHFCQEIEVFCFEKAHVIAHYPPQV